MSNVHLSGFDKSGINRMLEDTVWILLSGEDSGWFADCDVSLSSSYLDNDEIYRPYKGENEMTLNFLILA